MKLTSNALLCASGPEETKGTDTSVSMEICNNLRFVFICAWLLNSATVNVFSLLCRARD